MTEKELINADEIGSTEIRRIRGNDAVLHGHLKPQARLIVIGGDLIIEDAVIEGTVQVGGKSYSPGGTRTGGDVKINSGVKILNQGGVDATDDIIAKGLVFEGGVLRSRAGNIDIINNSRLGKIRGDKNNSIIIEAGRRFSTTSNLAYQAAVEANEIFAPYTGFNNSNLIGRVIDISSISGGEVLLGKEKSRFEANLSAEDVISSNVRVFRPRATLEIGAGRSAKIIYHPEEPEGPRRPNKIILLGGDFTTSTIAGINLVKVARASETGFRDCTTVYRNELNFHECGISEGTKVIDSDFRFEKSPDPFRR